MTMKTRRYLVAIAMTLAAALAFWLLLPHLPERIPVHFDIHGRPDRWGSPWTLFWVGPGTMAIMTAIFAVLPWLSPRRFGVEGFERTYLALMLIILAADAYFFAVMAWATLEPGIPVTKLVIGGVAGLAILLGNLMGKVRRNFFIGIRTPWTIASEKVWYATHRFAARSGVLGGVAAVAVLAVNAPAWIAIVAVAAGFLLPVLYSLLHYKRLERRGELDLAA